MIQNFHQNRTISQLPITINPNRIHNHAKLYYKEILIKIQVQMNLLQLIKSFNFNKNCLRLENN